MPTADPVVLVGAATRTQRVARGGDGQDAAGLMTQAARGALADSGAGNPQVLLNAITEVVVPKGIWTYADAGAIVSRNLGIAPRTVAAELGVLQTSPFARAINQLGDGDQKAVLIAAGEAKYAFGLAKRAGVPFHVHPDEPGDEPDETWRPAVEVLSNMEIERGLAIPAHQYALIERAFAKRQGWTHSEHTAHLGELWARYAQAAKVLPQAWDHTGWSSAQITDLIDGNRMVATPYTKRLVSQWNVDQAAAFILCRASTAREAGIDESRFVYPRAIVESNLMVHLSARGDVSRVPALDAIAQAVTASTGRAIAADAIDLYSCFPIAVQLQAEAYGVALDPAPTLTGGMSFGGGPLNNHGLQSLGAGIAAMRIGAVNEVITTAISGMMTKQGFGWWSSTAAPDGPAIVDVTEAARAATEVRQVDADLTGAAQIVSSTVIFMGDAPMGAVAIVEQDGRRSVAMSRDADIIQRIDGDAHIGAQVTIGAPGRWDELV